VRAQLSTRFYENRLRRQFSKEAIARLCNLRTNELNPIHTPEIEPTKNAHNAPRLAKIREAR